MKILAVYPEMSLSVIRRVKAPFSVLAERGHSFSCMEVSSFSGGLAHGYDVTVLCDWVLEDEEDFAAYREALLAGRMIVCDLSSDHLLAIPRMQEQLRLASLVTVPTETLKKEVGILTGRVAITPSCVDLPYFLHANKLPRPTRQFVGCFGPFDWTWFRAVLATLKVAHPHVTFLGGQEAYEALGAELIQPLAVNVESYPALLRACLFGVAPEAHAKSYDPVWRYEYGILCRPCLSFLARNKQTVHQMVSHLETLLLDPQVRAERGITAFREANVMRATQLAGIYGKVYREKLPYTVRA